jgi:hypothetical protein
MTTPTFRFYSAPDLATLPGVEWRVDDLLTVGGNAMLYGPSGAGKTFVMLAIAAAIATGRPVFGRAVRPGPVICVSIEGFFGLHSRLQAWKLAHEVAEDDPLEGLIIERDPVFLHNMMWVAAFIGALQARGIDHAALLTFDTLARNSVGSDEKDNAHRDQILEGLAMIRRRLDCGSLLVHHTGWDESRERGGSALGAGLDTKLRLTLGPAGPELLVEKQRDAPDGLLLPLRLAHYGTSLVAEPLDALDSDTVGSKAITALRALANIELKGQGANGPDWEKQAGLPHGTFNRIRKQLLDLELVEHPKARGPWMTTPKGIALLMPPAPPDGAGYCRVHRAIAMEVSPVTGALACTNCLPDLFPDRARPVEGGVIVEPQAGQLVGPGPPWDHARTT